MSPEPLVVAALQPALRSQQPMPNMLALRQAVQDLPASVDAVVLPESWQGLPLEQAAGATHASDAVQFLQNLARNRGVWIIGGTIDRISGEGARRSCLVVDRTGQIAGEYHKRILFGREQECCTPGTSAGVFDIEGVRVGILICADLWHPELARELCGRADLLCVPCKTTVPTDEHVVYARELWHALALSRAFENGIPVVVSDWASGRHRPLDVDLSTGSIHARGTQFDRGVLYRRHRDPSRPPTASGPIEPTAIATTSAEPALAPGVYFTAGASSICNPGGRPHVPQIIRTLDRGAAGVLHAEIDWSAVARFQGYRRAVGLLPPAADPPDHTPQVQ